MQATDLREGNNIACGEKLHATRLRAVLVEREMRSGVMMTLKRGAAASTEFEEGTEKRHYDRDGTAGPRKSPVVLSLVEI